MCICYWFSFSSWNTWIKTQISVSRDRVQLWTISTTVTIKTQLISVKEVLAYWLNYEGFPGGSVVKNLPAMQETQVPSLSGEDPLEKGMATHSSILVWRNPWTEEPGGLQSMGSQRVRYNWATKQTHSEGWLYFNIFLSRSFHKHTKTTHLLYNYWTWTDWKEAHRPS